MWTSHLDSIPKAEGRGCCREHFGPSQASCCLFLVSLDCHNIIYSRFKLSAQHYRIQSMSILQTLSPAPPYTINVHTANSQANTTVYNQCPHCRLSAQHHRIQSMSILQTLSPTPPYTINVHTADSQPNTTACNQCPYCRLSAQHHRVYNQCPYCRLPAQHQPPHAINVHTADSQPSTTVYNQCPYCRLSAQHHRIQSMSILQTLSPTPPHAINVHTADSQPNTTVYNQCPYCKLSAQHPVYIELFDSIPYNNLIIGELRSKLLADNKKGTFKFGPNNPTKRWQKIKETVRKLRR